MTACTPWRVAHVCHEANRALQVVNCDPSPSLPWASESEETRRFAVAAVEFAMRGGTPEEQFRQWRDAKEADGWTHGPEKDPVAKTHPCMVASYADLPEDERVKDVVFAAIVRAMTAGEVPCAEAGKTPGQAVYEAQHAAMRRRFPGIAEIRWDELSAEAQAEQEGIADAGLMAALARADAAAVADDDLDDEAEARPRANTRCRAEQTGLESAAADGRGEETGMPS